MRLSSDIPAGIEGVMRSDESSSDGGLQDFSVSGSCMAWPQEIPPLKTGWQG